MKRPTKPDATIFETDFNCPLFDDAIGPAIFEMCNRHRQPFFASRLVHFCPPQLSLSSLSSVVLYTPARENTLKQKQHTCWSKGVQSLFYVFCSNLHFCCGQQYSETHL